MKEFNIDYLIQMVIRLMDTDKESYQEYLDAISEIPDYFTINDFYELKYWIAWFGGSNMNDF